MFLRTRNPPNRKTSESSTGGHGDLAGILHVTSTPLTVDSLGGNLNVGGNDCGQEEDPNDFYQYVSLEDIADPADDPYISPGEESEGMDESDSSTYGSESHDDSSSDSDILVDD